MNQFQFLIYDGQFKERLDAFKYLFQQDGNECNAMLYF